MRTLVAAALLLLAAAPALAQAPPRRPGGPALPPFQCIGAEDLEDDVFEIPFAAGADRVTDAARSPLALAADLLRREPDRNACVLGHARREGGAATSVQLASRRARAVFNALRAAGVPEARLRSEARVAMFSRQTGNAAARNVSVVILPPARPTPERVAPAAPARGGPAARTPTAPAARPTDAPSDAGEPPATRPAAP